MHVHFIPVKISVVRSAHRKVKSKCGVWQDSDSMSHHGHSVQSWLSVEQHEIAILQAPFDNDPLIDFLPDLHF